MIIGEFLSSALRSSRYSRPEICDRMNEFNGRCRNADEYSPVTVNKLNDWTADSKSNHRFPLEYLPALCYAIHNQRAVRDMLRSILRPCGFSVITHNEELVFELFKAETHRDVLDKKIRSMRKEVAEKAAVVFGDDLT